MEAIEFQGQDKEDLKAAPGTEQIVYDLPVKRHNVKLGDAGDMVFPAVTSCWYFTDEEIEQLIVSKVIWFTALGPTHPPIMLSVEKPF